MTAIEKISIREYARRLGINDKTIRNQIGIKIIDGFDKDSGKIIPTIADVEFGHAYKVPKPRPGQSKEQQALKLSITETPESKNSSNSNLPNELPSDDDIDELDALDVKIHAGLSYAEATRRREIIDLALNKKKLQELEGVLVRKEDVERALFAFGADFKKALMNIPARITADVRSAANDVEAQGIVTLELVQILTQFSNLEEIKI